MTGPYRSPGDVRHHGDDLLASPGRRLPRVLVEDGGCRIVLSPAGPGTNPQRLSVEYRCSDAMGNPGWRTEYQIGTDGSDHDVESIAGHVVADIARMIIKLAGE